MNLEILALDTVVPQIRAPGVGDGYSAPRDITMALGTTFSAQAITAASNVTLSAGTANQVQYLNAGKVLTGSSNLTFDGTTLTVNSLSLTGSGVFPAGTALLPSITTVGDLNTGIYFPAADTIGFSEGGVEAMRLNASGNLGVGTQSPNARLDVNGGDFWFGDTANTIRNIVLRRNGATVGSISTVNQQFELSGGATLNASHLVITSGGNIGLNTASPLSGLHFNRAASGAVTPLASAVNRGFLITDSASTSATIQIGVNGGSPTYIQARNNSGAGASALDILLNPLGGNVGIGVTTPGDKLSVAAGRIRLDSGFQIVWQNAGTNTARIYSDAGNIVAFETGASNTERLRITSAGLLTFGGTTSSFPALKRVSAALNVRLADDTADAALTASELTASTSTVNLSSIVSSGFSLTGSSAVSLMDLSGTWNTTGTPTAIKLNMTDTASNASSLLLDLQTASTSRFSVTKTGAATALTLSASELTTTSTTANVSSIVTTGYSLTGSSALSLMDLSGTWNTSGTPTLIKANVTDTASNAASLLMDLQTGGTSRFNVAKTGTVTLVDAANVVVGTSTGTKIGTATSQKIGFWNAAPIVQPTTGVAAATVAATGAGDVVAASTTFDGYTIPQIVKAMRNAGLLA